MVKNKVLLRNIYYMLSYAYKTLREAGYGNVAAEDFDNIHDLFAAIIIRGVSSTVKRGLHHDYILREDALSGVRGQIRIPESIKQQTLMHRRLVCSFDEFTEDSLHNQIIKSTMLLLYRCGNVNLENRKALRKLFPYFGGVTEVLPAAIRWDALKYHRNNASYRMLVGICRLAIKGLLLAEEAGMHRLASWLHNGMPMLYQRFVLSYYRKHHPQYSPKGAHIDWDLKGDTDKAYLPRMESDITLQHKNRRLIIDTKFYSNTMQTNSQYNSETYISGNLYQMFSYVKNADKEASGNVAGIILYAKTDEG